jgi:hypothetical protein
MPYIPINVEICDETIITKWTNKHKSMWSIPTSITWRVQIFHHFYKWLFEENLDIFFLLKSKTFEKFKTFKMLIEISEGKPINVF